MEKLKQMRASLLPLLNALNTFRNQAMAPLSMEERVAITTRLKSILLKQYVAQFGPQTLSEYLWLAASYRVRTLPLISWEPVDRKPVAAILCVHGLGLENRAFEPFAAEMTKRGFLILAVDARGFGAWQTEAGSKTVDFKRTLSDIHAIIDIVKGRAPNLPVFLLGESMGGALVLRAASEFGTDMNGVIASVPSAERYGEVRTTLKVATHFLRGRNKAFNIGSQVQDQATSNRELRNLWDSDPKARANLSPMELIKFDSFMFATLKKCSQIQKTPVLIVQGLADRLVKPEGTYEMFDNVGSSDKSMLIIGDAEHLIFETPKQSLVLLDGLTAWLNHHIPGSQQTSLTDPKASPKP